MAQDGPPNGLKASPELKAYWQGNCSVYSPAQSAHVCQCHASCLGCRQEHTSLWVFDSMKDRAQSLEVATLRGWV